jgi:hypothetical protein
MLPNAIISSVTLLGLDDGVDGLKEVAATRGAPLPCSARFSKSGEVGFVFSMPQLPVSLWLEQSWAAASKARIGEQPVSNL